MESDRSLNQAEKWLRDGLDVCRPAAYFQVHDADMTLAKQVVEASREAGIRITYTHLVVRAVALTLAKHPELHVLVCGNRVHHPKKVDIGLSVAGETFVAPVLVLEGADTKDVQSLAREIRKRTPDVQAADRKFLAILKRWGCLVPVGFLRKWILRLLFRSFAFRTKGSGTFQVSVMPNLDQAIAPMFSASAILVAGRVQGRVVAVNGLAEVRPTMRLTLSADHRVWDGRAGERFLMTLQHFLSSDQLALEALGAPVEPLSAMKQAAHA